jgi:hypothetical protein
MACQLVGFLVTSWLGVTGKFKTYLISFFNL